MIHMFHTYRAKASFYGELKYFSFYIHMTSPFKNTSLYYVYISFWIKGNQTEFEPCKICFMRWFTNRPNCDNKKIETRSTGIF